MDERHRKEAGDSGESAALRYLRLHGLKLVERNYRCKAGELDLVMLDGPVLAIIEVRYRTSRDFGGAAGSVTRRKQRRIAIAAGHLLLTHRELRRYPARFDVVAISPGERIEWLKAAFTL
jgi:putative endonuclease